MKYISCFILIILLVSCQKEDNSNVHYTNDGYISFSISGNHGIKPVKYDCTYSCILEKEHSIIYKYQYDAEIYIKRYAENLYDYFELSIWLDENDSVKYAVFTNHILVNTEKNAYLQINNAGSTEINENKSFALTDFSFDRKNRKVQGIFQIDIWNDNNDYLLYIGSFKAKLNEIDNY